ncbi:ribonuclease H-like domain, reverse transcriptase, RNA-dependent DNA polymerase [Tanacetum coccineum]
MKLLLLLEEEPRNYKEAAQDKKWIKAMQIEIDSINKNKTWKLTTLPDNQKAIGLKWVFKTKRDADGKIINKARLVAKGYAFMHQARCAWNMNADQTLKSLRLQKCTLEKQSTQGSKDLQNFKSQMEEKFEMSDLGLLAYYLGIEVTQTRDGISIKQSGYANKILKEARMEDCNETKEYLEFMAARSSLSSIMATKTIECINKMEGRKEMRELLGVKNLKEQERD